MNICEIYKSINGESAMQGLPFIIIRTWGCNLNCSYCDSQFASSGDFIIMDNCEILSSIDKYTVNNVLITGGEPLLQEDLGPLVMILLDKGYFVAIETNGSISLSNLPGKVKKIVDIKCPSSGEKGSFDTSNLHFLEGDDEIKFVISSESDYNFAKEFVLSNLASFKGGILFSPAYGIFSAQKLAEFIINDEINVRLQIQLHKILWGEQRRR